MEEERAMAMVVRKGREVWEVEATGADREQVLRVGLRPILPTPFFVCTPPGVVLAELRDRNPGSEVVLGEL